MTARDLDALTSGILPELFASVLASPAVPDFAIAADASAFYKINELVETLSATAASVSSRLH